MRNLLKLPSQLQIHKVQVTLPQRCVHAIYDVVHFLHLGSPNDYVDVFENLEFDCESLEECTEIKIYDDHMLEMDKSFNVTLTLMDTPEKRLNLNRTAMIKIVDNDCKSVD